MRQALLFHYLSPVSSRAAGNGGGMKWLAAGGMEAHVADASIGPTSRPGS